MLTRFKEFIEAKTIIREKIGAVVKGDGFRSFMWIGEDSTVELRMGDKIMATVKPSAHEFEPRGRAPWCAVGVTPSKDRVPNGTTAFSGTRPAYYEADLDMLAQKILKIAEQFKGSYAKALALRQKNAETKDAQLAVRTAYVPRLIELGLAVWQEPGDDQYPRVVEGRKEDMRPISIKGMPYSFTSHNDRLSVNINVSYEKAAEVLSALRELLAPKTVTAEASNE